MDTQQAGTNGAFIPKADAQEMINTYQLPREINEKVCFFVNADLLRKLLDQNPAEVQIILAFDVAEPTVVLVGTDGQTGHVYYEDMVLEHVQPFNRTGQMPAGIGPQLKPSTVLE